MSACSTHYEVLGVQQACTQEEVKAAYQQLVLTLHPDKAGVESLEQFQRLQQAWQTLRDPASRALYDHQLSQAELLATVVLHDEVPLEDMDSSPAGPDAGGASSTSSYSHPCRCGDSFVVTQDDVMMAGDSKQLVIPCRSCSNHILVKLPS